MLAATSAIVTGFAKERIEPSGSFISGMTGLKAKKKRGEPHFSGRTKADSIRVSELRCKFGK
jgi:hypothetical protein